MIRYFLYRKNLASHYIYIDLMVDNIQTDFLELQLPAWRPGRYELGNFAKNVKRVDVFNENNETVAYKKINKDLWELDTRNCKSIKVTYSYYASELNAGACFSDDSQLYVNPVHCCLAVVGRTSEPHEIELKIPENYKIATSLKVANNTLLAQDYDELVDSPFIASADIQTDFYVVNSIKFYLHFNGICRPDFEAIKKDFSAFTLKQLEFWNDCPTDEYHFIFQILPFKFYHGVEHKKNTVIAIGPGYAINSGATYENILGVSCHELFHTWNIKTIRPIEMQPYDFTKENYARTGYVYEGFTTYYGDKLLLSSDVFTLQQYFETLQERLLKHFHNFGRYNLSVADSSWETWLDGYVPGAPYRKTNIYDEGSLIAFMLDVKILKATANKNSLRDVCVLLYERFGKLEKGYTEQSVIDLVNEVCGSDFSDFFKMYICSAADFELPLIDCFNYLGIELHKEPAATTNERNFGFKVLDSGNYSKVTLVAPYSPAWKAGLFNGDEILAVNNTVLKNNLDHWLKYFLMETDIHLTVNSGEQLKTIVLQLDKNNNTYFFNPKLEIEEPTQATENFTAWKKL